MLILGSGIPSREALHAGQGTKDQLGHRRRPAALAFQSAVQFALDRARLAAVEPVCTLNCPFRIMRIMPQRRTWECTHMC